MTCCCICSYRRLMLLYTGHIFITSTRLPLDNVASTEAVPRYWSKNGNQQCLPSIGLFQLRTDEIHGPLLFLQGWRTMTKITPCPPGLAPNWLYLAHTVPGSKFQEYRSYPRETLSDTCYNEFNSAKHRCLSDARQIYLLSL